MTKPWEDRDDFFHFTPVEWEVMQLVGDLYTYAEIAGRLHVSERTVRLHTANAALKLTGRGTPRERIIRHIHRHRAA